MSDEQALAETPVVETPATPAAPETPVDDGIVDLDAQPEVQEEPEGDDLEGKEKPEAESEAKTEEAKAEERKKLSGAQRQKLRDQRYQQELAERDRRIAELEAKTKASASTEGEEKRPREEDFNGDWIAFNKAEMVWESRQAAREELRKERETRESFERQARQREILQERQDTFNERAMEVKKVITDLDTVLQEAADHANASGIKPFTASLFEEVMSSDKSVELAYRLLKNPNEREALNRISDRYELARAVGRLEAATELPKPKTQTSAPAPLSRPKGGTAPHSQEAVLQAWLKKTYG